jgi:Lrp/AsnC family transcriptional regulator for asnA, asnC and gidA
MSALELDDIDRKLIERLAHDARVSNRKIALELGLAEGTIRVRIRRLLEARAIRVTAVTNMRQRSSPILALLWIDVGKSYHVAAVVEKLRAIREITFVSVMIGRADILAMTFVADVADLALFLREKVDPIEEIHHVEYGVGLDVVKEDYRWCPIVG